MTRPVVHLIAHTHWDREWYLPLGAFRARLAVALDGILAQLEGDPRIVGFLLDGQAVLVEDYLDVRPERQDSVARLIALGRLQAGPWYVLADEQIPSGESLLRNLLLGAAALRGLGRSLPILYSPDAFGHPSSLPLIGAECGLDSGVLWRGVDPEVIDHRDLFWWEAQDGRRILAYHLPPDGYEIGSNLLVSDEQLPGAWAKVASAVLPRAATRHVAVFVGADHHATAPELGTLAERLGRIAPAIDFRFSALEEFFASARREGAALPVVRGEQRASTGYTWSLQGVHGTRAPLKRLNSALELRLTRTAEPLAALLVDHGAGPAILRQAWRELVQCHFHDAIGGCASDAVARAVGVRFENVDAATEEVVRGALDQLSGHDPDLAREQGSDGARLLLWNRLARSRGGVVTAEVTFFRRDVLVGPPGSRRPRTGAGAIPFVLVAAGEGGVTEIAPQILGTERGLERVDATRHYPDQDEVDRVRIAFPLLEALPGLGTRMFRLRPGRGEALESFASAEGRLVWNGRVAFAVDGDGAGVLRAVGVREPFHGLFSLESEDDLGDTYTFCPATKSNIRRPGRGGEGRVRLTARGPLVAGLEWGLLLRAGREDRAGRKGLVSVRVSVEVTGDSPVLRCRIHLDNAARDHRLRLRFPTGLRGTSVLAGTHFGAVRRPPGPGSASRRSRGETPVATAPAHRFAAVARRERGLAIFAPGFFEYEWTRGGDLLVTLLRAVGELSRADLRTRPGHAGWPTPTPEAQCQGAEAIEFGIAPVSEEDLTQSDRLEGLWEDAFLPPIAHWIRDYHGTGDGASPGGITLEGEGLVLSGLKPAEDGKGAILRCYNAREGEVTGRLRLVRPVVRASRVRADETEIEALPLKQQGRELAFTVVGRGISSIRLEWKN